MGARRRPHETRGMTLFQRIVLALVASAIMVGCGSDGSGGPGTFVLKKDKAGGYPFVVCEDGTEVKVTDSKSEFNHACDDHGGFE